MMEEEGEQHTIIVVITDDHLLHFTIFTHLTPKILVEGIEMILELTGVHLVLGIKGRVLVEVR